MELAQAVVNEFKQRRAALTAEALADECDGMVSVFFAVDQLSVQALFDKDSGEFVELVASHHGEPPPGMPTIIYTISPPKGERW